MPIISPLALSTLPFSAEPFHQWNEQADLLQFLYGILDDNFIVTSEDGTQRHGNYSNLAPHYFEEGKANTSKWIAQFIAGAANAYPKPEDIMEPSYSYFENDPVFGKAVKYLIAWQRINAKALEDSLFFSIAHVLEAEFDINCVLQLATSMYYKQALQILRGYLESMVLPIYFCEYTGEFDKWKANSYRIPAMRGQRGILWGLANNNIISQPLADQTSILYDALNGYIHGRETALISRGVFTGGYKGLVFKEEDFHQWCEYVAQAIDVGIRLFAIHFDQWKVKSSGQIICYTCHHSNFDIKKEPFAGQMHHRYLCLHCGDDMILDTQKCAP